METCIVYMYVCMYVCVKIMQICVTRTRLDLTRRLEDSMHSSKTSAVTSRVAIGFFQSRSRAPSPGSLPVS